MDQTEAAKRAWALYRLLEKIADADAEQEVHGPAAPAIEALISACRIHVADDVVLSAIDGLITPETIENGQLRVVDTLIVVQQLALALGPERPSPVYDRQQDAHNIMQIGF